MEMLNEKVIQLLDGLRSESRLRQLSHEAAISFSHNDYLGLASHPEIRDAGIKALENGAAGSRGSRLLGGNTPAHESVEAALAEFFAAPAALFFSSGYLANLAAVTALAPLVDTIVSDELNHASLIDAIRLSHKPKRVYAHGRWVPQDTDGTTLLVTESLFSMDGDVIDWQELWRPRQWQNHWTLVDEAHAAGIFTEQGRGVTEQSRRWDRLCVTVTLGKAFGVGGAALLCSESCKQWVINSARSFIYTTAPPPVVAAMVEASLGVMKREGEARRQELWRRAEKTRATLEKGLPQSVFRVVAGEWNRKSPVLPVLTPGNDSALRLSQNMREFGFEVKAIRYPTVASGTERLRLSLNLGVSDEQTEAMVEKLVKLWTAYL